MAIVASSSSVVINNEVFISFRGETRKNFTSHLYSALCRKGIRTYRDDPNLERGDEISPALSRAIEESMISIVVFSKEYASSSWCLNELLHILKCKNERGQIVLSVFYNIDPSDIRKQKGSYAIAFAAHKKRFGPKKLMEWRNALTVAADLSGFHSQDQYETELIEKIVKDVLRKLNRLPQISIATKGLVGIDQQLEDIESLLCFGLPNPRVIGLWGLGGIGKTTLAIEIFNRFSYRFANCCFLENVRENSENHGLPYLETKLFSNLLEERDLESPVNSFVRNRLHNKTVLIVLDDVDNIRQLDCLFGDGNWFGPGSKVIITTRDAQLLKKDADKIHRVKPLDFEKALELFYLNAFKTKPSITRFIELSKAIVTYTGGNPLALKILSSSLHSQTITYWEHMWNKLKIIPNSDIQKVLKISYDGLDDTERDIFLDIACFLKGGSRDFIVSILDNCDLFASLGIEVLINTSLITINGGNVWMHDLIQEMGWEIVRQQSIKDPGERSRLWIPQDVYNVLKNNRGTRAIEGIYLDMSMIDDDLHMKPTVFNEMHRLRLLKIYIANHSDDHKFKIYLTEGLQFLPPSLRYLCWYSYPLKSLPSNYEGENLVELDMPCSELKQLWSGVQEGRRHTIEVCYPGNEIPKWFRHQDEGISTTMKLPHGWHNSNFMGFAICIVAPLIQAGAGSYSSKYEWRVEIRFDLHLKTKYGQIYKYDNNSGGDFWIYHDDEEEEAKILSSDITSDHVFMQCVTNSLFNRHPDAMEASFYFNLRLVKNCAFPQNENCDWIVKRIGVGLVYACK